MLTMIENYDSFSFNIVQYFAQLKQKVQVIANDEVQITDLKKCGADILLSPGPCDPNKAGRTLDVIDACHQHQKILGICLGYQALGQYFGGKIIQAKRPMHGKRTQIHHTRTGVFAGLPSPFWAVRYNSLVVANELPSCLRMTAWSQTVDNKIDEVMALEHKELPLYGVQFHPESISSEHGLQLFQNWLNIA